MTKDGIPPIPRHPKPKSKGKKPATPKLQPGPDVDALDVFEAAMDADAGSDSSSSSDDTFSVFIAYLSRPQLDKLDRLVQRVRGRSLRAEEEPSRQRTCQRIAELAEHRRQNAVATQASIRHKIAKRVDALDIVNVERTSRGQLKSLEVEGETLSVDSFIGRYLGKELVLVDRLLADGTLLRERKRQTPRSFLRRVLEICIDDDAGQF